MERRNFFTSTALLAAFGMASKGAATLPNTVIDGKAARVTHEPFGDLKIYFEGPTDQIQSMTAGSLLLKAGMEPHPPHQHPEEEFMVITEGKGEIVVDGKVTQVGPGAMMYCAGGRMHGIKNTGTTPLLFYFYKWVVK
jgi:mannose-6-phosphate isomerase-like protein (cupin superfamily)